MRVYSSRYLRVAALAAAMGLLGTVRAAAADGQLPGAAGTVQGVVVDPSGGVVAGASVVLENQINRYRAAVITSDRGSFSFGNVPPNLYHLEVTARSFDVWHKDVNVRSNVPIDVRVELRVAQHAESVEVREHPLLENVAVSHADVSSSLVSRLPSMSVASGLSDVVTLTTPGVVADSDGFFHPLGDHAQVSVSVDSQPITDQQGSVFSTQLPTNAIESMEIIYGVTPAEFGDKTSLVINTITKSGTGTKPHGDLAATGGTFDTAGGSATFGAGSDRFGSFTAVNLSRSGRFLDTPEERAMHADGSHQDVFSRLDVKPTLLDSLHVNLSAARSAFDIPNTWDQEAAGQDQRQRVRSFNIAPGWGRILNGSTLLSVNAYVRQDRVNYDPSASPFSDRPATVEQVRHLTNLGVKADLSHARGVHTMKGGVQIASTLLYEDFRLGVTDPSFNPVCVTPAGEAVSDPSLTAPATCVAAGYVVNPDLAAGLLPYDLTRGGRLLQFHGTADIRQQAAFFQDAIAFRGFTFNLGLRFDRYRGLTDATLWQPRLGASYLVKRTRTVLRGGYARSLETPFNENLVLSSATGRGGLTSGTFGAYGSAPLEPGRRHQLNAGLQQALGARVSLDVDYFWKRTANAFDLDALLNTAIVFPIEWHQSKMDGVSARLSLADTRGVSGFVTLGHTRARALGPETGGLIFNAPVSDTVGRMDHDQVLQATTHVQYRMPGRLPWVALTWRYDSGEVAAAVPDLASLLALTPNQQQTVGFSCGGRVATIGSPITSCSSASYGTRFVTIPAAGTANPDTNPARVDPRHILDLAIGADDLLRTRTAHVSARLTVFNLADTRAMYNFLSTCSGTHFVPARSVRAEVGVRF